jgi:hypothetical protein
VSIQLLGCDEDQAIAAKMLHLSKKVNELKQRVEAENMEKRTIIWKNAENSFNDFVEFTNLNLRLAICKST